MIQTTVRRVLLALILAFGLGYFFPTSSFALDVPGSYFLNLQTGWSRAYDPDFKLPEVVSGSLGRSAIFGIGAGYQLNEKLRFDFEVVYRGGFQQQIDLTQNAHARSNFASTSAMFNLNYDFKDWNNVVPFVGGGFGYVHNRVEPVSITTSGGTPLANIDGGGQNNLGIQFGGGITFPFADKWRLDVGYRYYHGGDYHSSDLIQYADGVNRKFSQNSGRLNANEFIAQFRIRLN